MKETETGDESAEGLPLHSTDAPEKRTRSMAVRKPPATIYKIWSRDRSLAMEEIGYGLS